MKKKWSVFFSVIFLSLLCACGSAKEKPIPLKSGTYEFQRAALTNILTGEVTQKTKEDILNDSGEWGYLSSFSVAVNENTEFIYTKDQRCITLKEGFAFELVGEDTLQIHLPYWRAYDGELYDIVIILGWEPRYY